MKEIEPLFLSTDICSILNEKDNEGIVKQKTIIEPKQHNVTAKSEKNKREIKKSLAEEYSNKKFISLNNRKNDSYGKNKQNVNISR